MGSTEKFCLQWNEFQSSIKTTFRGLRKTDDYADVTLACEDGQQIEAHRILLSSSCLFFRDLLKKNPHSHPLVYMRGIKHRDLSSIIDFIYHGEAEVMKDDLDTFLEVAGELHVQGMTKKKNQQSGDEMYSKERLNCDMCGKDFSNHSSLMNHNYDVHREQQEEIEGENIKPSFDCDLCGKAYSTKGSLRFHKYQHVKKDKVDVKQEPENKTMESHEDSINYLDKTLGEDADLETRIDALTEYREGVWTCIKCGKNDKSKFHLRRHSETHVDGFTFACNKCEKTFPHRNPLKSHILKTHPEERTAKPFNCDICSSEHTTRAAVKYHKERMHKSEPLMIEEGVETSNENVEL